MFTLSVSLAPLGTEKLALRVLSPAHDAPGDGLLRQYLRFAVARVCLGTAAAVFCALTWAFVLADLPAATRLAVLAACLALPPGAATHLGQEVLTAGHQARLDMTLARVQVPGVAMLTLPLALGTPFTGAFAIFCWTLGWLAAALWMGRRIGALLPAQPAAPAPVAAWSAAARPLWLYKLAVGLRGQAGLIALVWLHAPPGAVGAYATASAIVGLLVVPVAATNRVYASDIARFLQAGDAAAIARLHARRLRWLVPVALAFVLAIWVWAGPILGLIRPEFAQIGTGPLRVLTFGAALTLIFALAPTHLKFRGQNGVVFAVSGAAAADQRALLILLIPRLGATGAALAYALPTVASYAVLARLARE